MTLSFAITVDEKSSQRIGVDGWGCPILSRMRQMIFMSLALTKGAADMATNCKRDMRKCIDPFNFIGCLSWGIHPRK